MRGMLIFLTLFAAQAYAAPQFITFKDGKLGVNFGGYHAGVGIGGLLDGGPRGGLFAEAGTPHGQNARAGLGGKVDESGEIAGGLYAKASAARNIGAAAGLGGNVGPDDMNGEGFAYAQRGNHRAVSRLAGETNAQGSAGIAYSGTSSFAVPSTIVKETHVSVLPVETVKHKKVHKEFKVDALNEITPVAAIGVEANAQASLDINSNAQPTVVVKEVSNWIAPNKNNRHSYATVNLQDIMNYVLRVPSSGSGQTRWKPYKSHRFHQVHVEQQPQIVEKHIIHTHTKPRHHVQKTAYIGGFIGAGVDAAEPAIQKRIDVGAHSAASGGAEAEAGAYGGGHIVSHTKEVTVSRNPTFFQDIFNIPISTLKAVSSFLTNTAAKTNISIQKSATVHAGASA